MGTVPLTPPRAQSPCPPLSRAHSPWPPLSRAQTTAGFLGWDYKAKNALYYYKDGSEPLSQKEKEAMVVGAPKAINKKGTRSAGGHRSAVTQSCGHAVMRSCGYAVNTSVSRGGKDVSPGTRIGWYWPPPL